MRSATPHLRRTTTAAAALRSIMGRTLLASALLGTGAAQAGLIITSDSGALSAFTPGGGAATASPVGVDGSIVERVESQQTVGSGNLARAELQSFNQPGTLFAVGEARLALAEGLSGAAQALYTLNFTLTSRHEFTGFVQFRTTGGADLLGQFDLDLLGPGGHSILSATEASPDIDALFTLDPGEYRIRSLVSAISGLSGAESGATSFGFDLQFTDLGDPPPAVVPEPQSLALTLAGLLAAAAVRRRSRA